MKKLLIFSMVFFCLQLMAQRDIMFEMVTVTPKEGMSDALISKMKMHNDKFHAQNPYGARVYSINTGTQAGKLVWTMGPTTWTDMENRPGEGAHDDDWKNVTDLLENEMNVEYFRLEPSLSNFPKDFDIKNLWIRFTNLKSWEGYRYRAMMEKIQKVYAEKMPDQTRGVYWNTMGNSKDGRDVMTVQFFNNLSWMDEEGQFTKKFEEVYGPNSWMNFMREVEEVVEGSDIMMLTLLPEMGGLGSKVIAADRQ